MVMGSWSRVSTWLRGVVVLAVVLGAFVVDVPAASAAASLTAVTDVVVPAAPRGSTVASQVSIDTTEGATFQLFVDGFAVTTAFDSCEATLPGGATRTCTISAGGDVVVGTNAGTPDEALTVKAFIELTFGDISLDSTEGDPKVDKDLQLLVTAIPSGSTAGGTKSFTKIVTVVSPASQTQLDVTSTGPSVSLVPQGTATTVRYGARVTRTGADFAPSVNCSGGDTPPLIDLVAETAQGTTVTTPTQCMSWAAGETTKTFTFFVDVPTTATHGLATYHFEIRWAGAPQLGFVDIETGRSMSFFIHGAGQVTPTVEAFSSVVGSVAPGAQVRGMVSVNGYPGLPAPTGGVSYDLVGPNPNATCSGPSYAFEAFPLNIVSPSSLVTVLPPGRYSWVVRYGGDDVYASASDGCGDPHASFTVVALPPASSEGCAALNAPSVDGRTNSKTLSGYEFWAGDRIVVTASDPSTQPFHVDLKIGGTVAQSATTAPATLVGTVPAFGDSSAGWEALTPANDAFVAMTYAVSCEPGPRPGADLSLTKTCPSSGQLGASYTCTVTVRNDGPEDAHGLVLGDSLPVGMDRYTPPASTPAAPTGFTCTDEAEFSASFGCTLPSLAAGDSASVTYEVFLVGPAKSVVGTTLTNVAHVSADEPDLGAGPNQAVTRTLVTAPPPGPDSPCAALHQGAANGTYGTGVFTGDFLAGDRISIGTSSWLGANPRAFEITVDGNVVVATSYPTLSGVYTFPEATVGTVVTWRAYYSGSFTIPAAWNVDCVPSSADLSVDITCPGSAYPATTIACSATVSNDGPTTAEQVSLAMPLPSTFSVTGTPSGGGFTCGSGPPFTCTLPTLAANASATVNFSLAVSPNASTGSTRQISATVTASTPDPGPNANTDVAPVFVSPPSSDLGITKSCSSPTIAVGGTVSCTLTVTNAGPQTAPQVSVQDDLPTGLSLQGTPSGSGFSCGTGDPFTCTRGSLPAGTPVTITYTLKAATGLTDGSTLTNAATVSSAATESGSTPNSAEVTLTVDAKAANLSLTKSCGTGPYLPGDTVVCTLTVANAGPDAATGVQVVDDLPTGLALQGTPGGGGFTCGTGDPFTCTLGSLADGASAAIVASVKIPTTAAGGATFTNTATVSSTTTDPGPGVNTASATIRVRSADLALAKTCPTAPVDPGAVVTCSWTVTNHGPDPAQLVAVVDALPAGLALQGIPSGGGFLCGTGNPFTCTLAQLNNGASATVTYLAKVSTTAAGGATLTNSATASSPAPDPGPGENTASATITVGNADLGLAKSCPTAPVNAGGVVTCSWTVTNNGPTAANQVKVVDDLPTGLTLQGTPSGGGFSCGTGDPFTCTLPSLASGSSSTVSYALAVGATVAGGSTLTNTATVSSSTPDPGPGVNTASQSLLVNRPPTITIATPIAGKRYFVGQVANAAYACADQDGTVTACAGPVPVGTQIDTSTAGTKTFTVNATDNHGGVASKTVTYTVHPVIGPCRATVVRGLGRVLGTANPTGEPCITVSSSGPSTSGAFLTSGTLMAWTATTGATHSATAVLVGAKLGGFGGTFTVDALSATVTAQLVDCDSPPVLTSASSIGKITINGRSFAIGTTPSSYRVPFGTLYIGQTQTTATSITRTAVFLDLPGTAHDIRIAEVTAGAACGALPSSSAVPTTSHTSQTRARRAR